MTKVEVCKSKVKHKTRKIAWRQALYYFINYGTRSTPYKCAICNKFHLTAKFAQKEFSKEFIARFNNWFGSDVL